MNGFTAQKYKNDFLISMTSILVLLIKKELVSEINDTSSEPFTSV